MLLQETSVLGPLTSLEQKRYLALVYKPGPSLKKPAFRDLFMIRIIRDRVVPTMSPRTW